MRITPFSVRLGNDGLAALEFALVAPFLILMLMGASEVTGLLRAQLKVNHAAGLLAKMVAQQADGVSTSILNNVCYGAELALTPMPLAGFSSAIASVTTSTSGSSTTTAMDWEKDNSCSTSAIAIGATAAIALASSSGLVQNAGDSLIIIKSSYNYIAATHYILGASYKLTQNIYSRPRTNMRIACRNC